MKPFKTIFLYLIIAFSCSNIDIFAQIDKARIFTAYINNFAKYTLWQDESKLDSFRIAVYTENQDLITELKSFISQKKIKNKPIALNIIKSNNLPKKANIIFLTKETTKFLSDIYDAIDGKNILMISEEYADKRSIMINLYQNSNNQIKFEVNKANIIGQNLQIDPEILLLGGTEVDVANLYRKSQIDLRQLQKKIDTKEDSLNVLFSKIFLMNQKIEGQENKVRLQRILYEEQIKKIDSLYYEIELQKKAIETRQAVLMAQKDSINTKNIIYLNQLEDIKKKSAELEILERKLISYKNRIGNLNNEISNKNWVLDTQSQKIKEQNKIITLLYIIGFLVLLLIFTIYISYKKNKNKNIKLTIQKQEIEEKLKELELLNEKLQKSDQYKSIFLASMSHELRTPLNSIIGYTGILLMGMTGILNDEQIKQLSKVKNNAKHLLSLINDILDISKIEAERVELQIEPFTIKSVVDSVLETLHPKATEKGIKLYSIVSEDISIISDNRRLLQVIINLAGNAVNYTDEGEVQVRTSLLENEKIKISVIDTGIGIADSELERLFQPFQQIDSSLTKKNSGTGLGLYLSKKIINMLGGEIFVKSELGKGSEFYVIIPVELIK